MKNEVEKMQIFSDNPLHGDDGKCVWEGIT